MQPVKQHKKNDPRLSFHLMKFAVQDFQKNSSNLTEDEYNQAYQHAYEEMLLHKVILSSDEASCVVIPDAILQRTLCSVITEFPDEDAFHIMLEANNLRVAEYMHALHNDLRVETVLGKVASSVQTVPLSEIQRYYHNHKTQFCRPEQRNVSLIQIFADSPAALATISEAHERLCRHPENFESEARNYSECDTGKDGGEVGTLGAGELCDEIDSILFSLNPGEISPIIKSDNAYHIIRCNAIYPSIDTPLTEATPQILPILLKKKQLNACRIWLQKLVQGSRQD